MPLIIRTEYNTLMWFKILLFLLLAIPAYAGLPPTRILDEGVDKGVAFKFDCVGAGIACTQSGVTGTLTVGGVGGGDSVSIDGVAVVDPNFNSTGDVDFVDTANVVTGIVVSVRPNSVKLGTDTTGNYAGSSSEGGEATTATALAADPADCATSTHFAVGVTAAGVATCEAIADADVPDTITVDLATTVTTNANLTGPITSVGNATTVASTVGGRSLTVTANVVDADAELYTWTLGKTIETPTSADNFLMHRVPLASTVTNIHCIVEAATSATIRIDECDTAGDNCTGIDGATTIVCDVDGQADDTSLSNAAIDATDWLRTVVTATSGTPGHVAITVTGLRENKVFVFYTES